MSSFLPSHKNNFASVLGLTPFLPQAPLRETPLWSRNLCWVSINKMLASCIFGVWHFINSPTLTNKFLNRLLPKPLVHLNYCLNTIFLFLHIVSLSKKCIKKSQSENKLKGMSILRKYHKIQYLIDFLLCTEILFLIVLKL